jgi:heme/copper-type cytochrome/quinol oxidase subunit 1
VNLALMGLLLRYCLPAMGRPVPPSRYVQAEVLLFGVGQLIACVGLFWAGGYGAPRKIPGGTASLADGAVMGMYLHGLGALIAIAGGIMFVATLLRALMRSENGLHFPSLSDVYASGQFGTDDIDADQGLGPVCGQVVLPRAMTPPPASISK